MPNDSTLSIVVKLRDEASAQLEAMAAKVQAVGSTVASTAESIGASMSSFGTKMINAGESIQYAGQKMTMGLTVPLAALGYGVVETSMKFQSSMELIRTQAGATQDEVDSMTKSVLALAKSGETGQGPEKLAEGLYHIESLGYRGAQALDILKTSAQAADLGLADMEGVTNALGAAIVTGIKGTQDMSQAMGLLDATIGQGNMRMNDLVAALGTGVLPVAKNFGLSLQDVGASLAVLTDNGMRADEAATRLRMSFSLMAAPSQKATEVFASIGLSQLQLADDMRQGGIIQAMQDLKDHLEATGFSASRQAEVLSQAFGGGRSDAAILTLLEQLDRLKTKYDLIGQSADTFAEKVAATHLTNQFKLNAALAQMQATLIDLGGSVMPMVAQMLQVISGWMQNFTSWWDKLSPATQGWIVKGLALLAVLGPFLVILGSITTAIGVLAKGFGLAIESVGLAIRVFSGLMAVNPIVLAVVAVVLILAFAAYELWKHWDTVSGWIKAMWENMRFTWNAVVDSLSDKMLAFSNGLLAVWKAVKDFFGQLGKDIEDIVLGVVNAITSAFQGIIDAYNRMKAIVSVPVGIVSNFISGAGGGGGGVFGSVIPHFDQGGSASGAGSAFGSVIPHFDQGGIVPGMAGQAVPAIVHAGEEVIPANQVSRRSGSTVNIIIQNPSVRRDSDISDMRKQLEQLMRPLLLNAKVIHV